MNPNRILQANEKTKEIKRRYTQAIHGIEEMVSQKNFAGLDLKIHEIQGIVNNWCQNHTDKLQAARNLPGGSLDTSKVEKKLEEVTSIQDAVKECYEKFKTWDEANKAYQAELQNMLDDDEDSMNPNSADQCLAKELEAKEALSSLLGCIVKKSRSHLNLKPEA